MSWRMAAAGVLSAGIVGALVVGLWLRGTEFASWLAGIAGSGVIITGLFGWALRGSAPAPEPTRDEVRESAQILAEAVDSQWTGEAANRHLFGATPLRVGWTAHAGSFLPARGTSEELDQLVVPFTAGAGRRLVIIGAAGAGKTCVAILMMLELLRRNGLPVPIFLSLSGWQPRREPYRTWLVRRIAEDHPSVDPAMARALFRAGLITPVLDGLDELPASERAAAFRQLNSCLGPADSLIITCRTREYERIIAEAEPLTAAAVVEIDAVAADDVIAYLAAAIPPRARQAWDAVLGDERAAAMAGALDRPLMLWLLRKTYLETARDPRELLDAVQAGPEVVHARLLDGLVTALYEPGGRSLWPEDQARSWFGFLARHLIRLGTHDLAWWQLHRALPRHCAPLALGAVAAATVLTTFMLAGVTTPMAWVNAAVIAEMFILGLEAELGGGTRDIEPMRVDLTMMGRVRLLAGRIAGRMLVATPIGACFTILAMVLFGPQEAVGIGLTFIVLSGVAIGVVDWAQRAFDAGGSASPRSAISADRTATLLVLFVGITTCAVATLVALWFGLVVDGSESRIASFPYVLSAAAALGFVFALVGRPRGLAFGPYRAWPLYVVSRWYLTLRGRCPARLGRFLGEAHELGVLRQVGGVYQFRHADLRDHLAAPEGSR
ncbi:NACHT domain-containing protein [Actinomadura rubrisoli]|uniref:NACHT domain-containing protein n=1 Tax=Actinomadura rubrisoli TaxID=2530368 RepID=A0A4R5B5B8_9ACTN|nr:NACHT domain-containing protein [Actinomadura rubrisoli]TDD80173.1 NACHT domain-containing protein [Actinomadura rubrisoli]